MGSVWNPCGRQGCSWYFISLFVSWDRVAQAGLQLIFIPPQLHKYWDYRHATTTPGSCAPYYLSSVGSGQTIRYSEAQLPANSIQTSTGQTCWLWIQMAHLENSTDLWVILFPTFQGYIFLSLRCEMIAHRYLISFQKLSGLKMIYNSSHSIHREFGLEPARVVFSIPHNARVSSLCCFQCQWAGLKAWEVFPYLPGASLLIHGADWLLQLLIVSWTLDFLLHGNQLSPETDWCC